MERKFGVHSEVGRLRTVMVCRPGLAHHRLTPDNCRDLLFDDVIWADEAQKDHDDFVRKMQQRGVEVLELHDLLVQVLDNGLEQIFKRYDRSDAENYANAHGAKSATLESGSRFDKRSNDVLCGRAFVSIDNRADGSRRKPGLTQIGF